VPIPSTIVVPLDGSRFAEQALPVAGALAQRLDAELALVCDLILVSAPWEEDRDAADTYLRQIADETTTRVADTIVVEDRPPVDAVVEAARAAPGRIVCMTTHGRGRFRWAVVGSVAEGVVSRLREPVVLVGPRGGAEPLRAPGRMVIGVDGSPASLAVVPHACEWARALHLDVEVAFVAHPLDVEDAVHPDTVLGPVAERVAAEGLTVHPVLLRSSYPAGELVDLAETLPASMIAMTTNTRAGLARFAVGSVTMGVLNTAPCPVLVTRPEDLPT
jgi:nucleotide-binding universal stress UspA family protein